MVSPSSAMRLTGDWWHCTLRVWQWYGGALLPKLQKKFKGITNPFTGKVQWQPRTASSECV